MVFGITIIKVMLKGEGVKDSALEFKPGLNIIHGPSDCGKTLAASCIEYVLGKSDKVDLPKIADGYTYALVEIQSNDSHEVFSLARMFDAEKMNDVYVFNGMASEFVFEKVKTCVIKERKGCQLLSDFLLEQIQCPYKYMYKNGKGETKRFSARNFFRMSMLDETRIDEKFSIFLASASNKADYKNIDSINAAHVFLSGIKLPPVEKVEDVNRQKARKEGMILGIQETLTKLQKENGKFSEIKKIYDIDELNDLKNKLNKVVQQKRGEIIELSNRILELKNQLNICSSQYIAKKTEIKRFSILKESYIDDKSRLEFIDQACGQDSDMLECQCPVCKSNVKIQEIREDFREDCINEIKRLNQLIKQIEISLEIFYVEQNNLEQKMRQIKQEISQIENELANGLAKDIEDLVRQIDEVSSKIYVFQKYVSNQRLIEEYNKRIDILKAELSSIKKQKVDTSLLTQKICELLSTEIRILLIKCQFANKDATVSFDTDSMDIVIDGQKKESFGSGVRSVLNSLVSIGIMLYCMNQDLCHPGFIILDSPIAKYYEEGRTIANFDQIFYQLMLQVSQKCQIIIFENRKPNAMSANIVHFTKDASLGRAGFVQK